MSALVPSIVTTLGEILGPAHVSTVEADRRRCGALAPSIVCWPTSAPEVAQVLKLAATRSLTVAVVGAGTRSASFTAPEDGRLRVALCTQRMSNILKLDESSLTVHCQAGLLASHLEESLARHGLSLGPLAAPLGPSTVGGALAGPHTENLGSATHALGEACLGLSVARPDGSVIHTRVAPRRATGPDLQRLYLGSWGALGVITTAVLRAHRLPESSATVAHLYPSVAAAARASRELLALGVRPRRVRIVNQTRAAEELDPRHYAMPAAALTLLEGPALLLRAELEALETSSHAHGGTELPKDLSQRWHAHLATRVDPGSGASYRVRHSQLPAALALLEGSAPRPFALDGLELHALTLWLPGDDPAPDGTAVDRDLCSLGSVRLRPALPEAVRPFRALQDPDGALAQLVPMAAHRGARHA
ncbi:MAG: FAD-binding oxidoreductase [Deltaproteobacteria bacterium]|nr:FAD-binding oxidoreductase [Deltaproteobacteria bacterium]